MLYCSGLTQEHKPGTVAITTLLETCWEWVIGRRGSQPGMAELLAQNLQAGWGCGLVRGILEAVNGTMPSWMLDNLAVCPSSLSITAVFEWIR